MPKSLIACVLLGAAVGFVYSWRKLAYRTARNIEGIMELPMNPNDKSKRLTRDETIRHIKGLHLEASMLSATGGALIGLAAWVAMETVSLIMG